MGFEDIFENKQKHRGNYREQKYPDKNRNSYDSHHSDYEHNDHLKWLNILKKIRGNQKLKMLVVVAGILILAIAVMLIIFLLPVIMKLLNYISQNGLQGLIDEITIFLDKIWKGSGN